MQAGFPVANLLTLHPLYTLLMDGKHIGHVRYRRSSPLYEYLPHYGGSLGTVDNHDIIGAVCL